jgi:16S rRNA (guanine966-N2)-methyltransferase
MRIVAGKLGGRTLVAPKTRDTRPMTDKVRAALFDSVGDITDMMVLDAYAGSGAVGFEALSRGAARVIAIESARPAIRAVHANVEALDVSWGYELHETSVETWLARRGDTPWHFDVITADPPYASLKPDIIEKLGGLLVPDGLIVVSHSARMELPELEGLILQQTKAYGDTGLSFYKPA